MNEPIHEWVQLNKPSSELLWKDAFWDQVNFVRHQIAGTLARNRQQYDSLVRVVGTHTSKSITCPIYYIHLEKEGIEIWMRYNFFNWNISIQSHSQLDCDFLGLVSDKAYDYCFCEGMEQWKFGRPSESKIKFTFCVSSHYDCYVIFRALRHCLGITLDKE